MTPLLDVSDLFLRRGEHAVFEAASFQLHPGEAVILRGPSGSGKSSFLALLLGELRPDAGRIVVDGVDLDVLRGDDLAMFRRRVGFACQEELLLPAETAGENVSLPLELAEMPEVEASRRAAELLAAVGLEGKVHTPAGKLSGGERRRVGIARAVALGPRLLLLDEPTASLDPDARDAVLAVLRKLHDAEIPMLITTHDEAVQTAVAAWPRGRTVRVDRGKLIRA